MGNADKCGGTHHLPALSVFTAVVSGCLILSTVGLNLLILITIVRNKSNAFKPVFFRAVLNIALADLFTGIIVDSLCFNFVIKEALGLSLSQAEKILSHLSFFIFSGVAVITVGLMSIERLWALIKPVNHLKGQELWQSVLIAVATWLLSIGLSMAYFTVGYIKCLVVFASTTVVFSFILMIVMLLVYERKLVLNRKKRGSYSVTRSGSNCRSSRHLSIKGNLSQSGERRVTNTFMLMLAVFLISFLPTVIMIIYMNNCTKCHCTLIHTMRDLTYLLVVAGALMRPINYMLRLRVLRRAVKKTISGISCIASEDNSKISEVSIKLRSST